MKLDRPFQYQKARQLAGTKDFVKKNYFLLSVILIILLSVILRFANYGQRWGIAHDQALSALVARHALLAAKFPLLGPFSSAGPFQTGGQWYWFVMLGTLFYPYSVISPWVFLTFTYVLFVFFLVLFATRLENKIFGIIVGLLAAMSSAQIFQGTNLTNQSPISLFSLFAIWSAVEFIRRKEAIYLFFLGLSIGTAASIHLQGILLAFIIPALFVASPFLRFKDMMFLALGISLPFFPILLSDLSHNFFNFRNMIYYFLHDQYKISFDVLGRRWLTYLTVFWPVNWAHVIGGHRIIGYIFMIGSAAFTLFRFYKRNLSKEWLMIALSFLGMIVMTRYTRTPLFESYIVFLHPFVLLFSALFLYEIVKRNIAIGVIFIAFVSFFTLQKDIAEIRNSTNLTPKEARRLESILLSKYPGNKFAIYDYRFRSTVKSFALTLFLDVEGKIDDKGIKIGLGTGIPDEIFSKYKLIHEDNSGLKLLNLDDGDASFFKDQQWHFVNPSQLYYSTQDWFR